jgi:hypothetical protein
VRSIGRRTKKLIVAFHFQNSDQAAWECDSCRRSGLDKRRNCGWREDHDPAHSGLVWAASGVALKSCPKSFITGESMALLERFHVWKILGTFAADDYPARLVDGFCVLQNELLGKENHGK